MRRRRDEKKNQVQQHYSEYARVCVRVCFAVVPNKRREKTRSCTAVQFRQKPSWSRKAAAACQITFSGGPSEKIIYETRRLGKSNNNKKSCLLCKRKQASVRKK